MGKDLFTRGELHPKLSKGKDLDYGPIILHLAPHKSVGLGEFNVCPFASPGCIEACLNTAGRGGLFKPGETTNSIQKRRKERTEMFFYNKTAFMQRIIREINNAIKRNGAKQLQTCVRMNGTSDIKWENIKVKYKGFAYNNIMKLFPDIIFYDYSKIPNRRTDISNYDITFSRSEINHKLALSELRRGQNVAVVFRTDKFPKRWNGYRVVSGDKHDFRFLDPRGRKGYVIALKAKGKARYDESGFVVDI